MKIDGIAEARLVAEPSAAHLDQLDPAVDAFRAAVVGIENDGVEDVPQVRFDHPGNLSDRLPRVRQLNA